MRIIQLETDLGVWPCGGSAQRLRREDVFIFFLLFIKKALHPERFFDMSCQRTANAAVADDLQTVVQAFDVIGVVGVTLLFRKWLST